MARNIEIKAKIHQLDSVKRIAEQLCGHLPEQIKQEDIFFPVAQGRLKLRILSPSSGELIFYQRDDTSGPKTCTYQIVETDRP
ncbi:MAG: hypothetical protein JKY99_08285 [Rhizobiales bacterium]|nr:hypothetical protein [Hyphomicrobiales bacterium]